MVDQELEEIGFPMGNSRKKEKPQLKWSILAEVNQGG